MKMQNTKTRQLRKCYIFKIIGKYFIFCFQSSSEETLHFLFQCGIEATRELLGSVKNTAQFVF